MQTEELIGITAGVFTSASLLPQLIKMLREKKVEDVSPLWLIILFAGLCLWVVYGFMKTDWPIILTNIFSLTLNAFMLVLRFKYKK
jgi:MtN3 and saliva related transmembrane protein